MSRTSVMRYAKDMRSRSAFLRENCRDLAEYMDPECPSPIFLLGRLGGESANGHEEISPREWASLSAMIEQGLASDDGDVGTAVATGLIEGLIHRAETAKDLWPRIEAGLGPLARSYADAYRSAG